MPNFHPLGLYRRLLREGQRFFDPVGQWYITWRTRDRFQQYRHEQNPTRNRRRIGDGMQLWRKLKRANGGVSADAQRVIHLAYGVAGRVRHMKDRYQLLSVSTPHRIPDLDQFPYLIRLLFLSDRQVFEQSLYQHIAALPRHQRRLYKEVFQNSSMTSRQEPEEFKTILDKS